MLIDWFTVGAQALNFIVLVWLMKRFLYRPVLAAMAARGQRIAQQQAEAATQMAEAQRQRDALVHQATAFEQQRAGLLDQAVEAARAEGSRLLAQARVAADGLVAQRQQALRDEAASLALQVGQRTQQEVFAIVRRTLADLASSELEERLVTVFIARLQALQGEPRMRLVKALLSTAEPAGVRSAFALPTTQRTAVQAALDAVCGTAIRLRYETVPDLVNGVELSADGLRLAWSVDDHLAAMQRGLAELVHGP
jgi:F-type H+-transporting ATPase subunit b